VNDMMRGEHAIELKTVNLKMPSLRL
jgi:hypothetical protein